MHPMVIRLTALLVLAVLVAVNHWAMTRFLNLSYLDFFLANGTLVGIGLSFGALTWGGSELHRALVSSDPLVYVGANGQVIGLVFYALGAQLRSSPGDQRSSLDLALSMALSTLLFVAIVAWILVAMPGHYFVQLLTGAPARCGFDGAPRTLARIEGGQLRVQTAPRASPVPEGWWDASLFRNPLAATGAFTALVFLLIKYVRPLL